MTSEYRKLFQASLDALYAKEIQGNKGTVESYSCWLNMKPNKYKFLNKEILVR